MAELEESLEMSHPKPPQLSAAELAQQDGGSEGTDWAQATTAWRFCSFSRVDTAVHFLIHWN